MTQTNSTTGRTATRPPHGITLVGGTGEEPPGQPLPEIDAGEHDLPRLTAAAWHALKARNDPPQLFRFGDLIVRLEVDDRWRAVTRPLTFDRLYHELVRAAHWYGDRYSRGPVGPPERVVRDMLASPQPPLPRLTQITAAPVFSATGILQSKSGYCVASESYFAAAPEFSMRSVGEDPSAQEICEARHLIIQEVFGDFLFVSPADLAAAVSGMLTPFVRNLIDGPAPLHVYDKPTHRTGTTLAAQVSVIPINGGDTALLAPTDDESEMRKRITAELIGSPPTVTIDNADQLDSASLAVVLTAPWWKDRVLGRSEMTCVPARAVWYVTGTNIELSREICQRSVYSRQDARVAEPWQRTGFRHPRLRRWVLEHRDEIVWAVLTLAQAWLVAGRPPGRVTLGGFESWAEVVGGILDLVGIPGLLDNLAVLHQSRNPEDTAWAELVSRWRFFCPAEPVGVKELWGLLTMAGQPVIDLDLGPGIDQALRTRFGKRIGKLRGKVIGGYQIVEAGTRQGAQLWRLQPVSESTSKGS